MAAFDYDREFFARRGAGSLRSAQEIVPLALSLTRARSVVDVGCGTGTWLAVFREHGIDDVLGIDGTYVDPEQLIIPPEKFCAMNFAAPLRIDRRFELALCLEVAEHLPSDAAGQLVDFLCSLSAVVLFSAAIPHQGGYGHLNEQWPEYWVKKFNEYDYLVLDPIRPKIWTNPRVQWWYAQNTLLFVRRDQLLNSTQLQVAYNRTEQGRLALVHPTRYMIGVKSRGRC